MGISGLLPLLKEVSVNGHISEFKGKKLAVDGYVWLHKGAFGCAEDLVKGKKSTKFVDYAMYRVRFLRHHGIEPFLVFDGGPLPAKKGTEVSRAKSRLENLEKARSLEAQGRIKEAKEAYTRCVDVTPEMAYQLIKALRAENVDYVVAPYEADAQLCFLEREGYVDGIITEDSDLLLLQHIRLEGNYLIPPTYLSDFAQAELAFLYQRVYDPSLGRLVHLNPLPPTTTGFQLGEEGEKWVGVDVEEGLARRMASGDVHPETGLEIVDEWPEFAGGSGGAGCLGGKRQAKAHEVHGVHGVHVQGPMDAFITRFKKPKHHHPKRDCPDYSNHANHEQQHIKSKLAPIHQPVGTYTSGASRLSDQLALRPLAENVMREGEDGCMTEKVEVMSKFFGGRGKGQIRKRQKDEEKNEDGGEEKIELEWEEEEEEQEGGGPTHSLSRSLTPNSTPTRIRQRRRSPSPAISSLIASSPPPPPLPRMGSQSFPSPQSFSPCPSPSLSPVASPSFSSYSRQGFMSQTQYITSPPAAECSSPPVLDFPISSFAEEDKRKQGINVGREVEMETETETKMFERGSSFGMVVSPTSSPTPPLPLSLSRTLLPTRVQSMGEDKSEESEKEEEERKEKAKMVGGSWRAKWAFGGGLEMKGTPKFGAGASAKRAQKQTPKTVPVQKKTSTLTRSSTLTLSKRREAMSTGASSRVLKNRPVNVVRGERESLRSGLLTPTRAPSMTSVSASSTTERNGMEMKMKMKVAVKQFGFGRAGRKGLEVSGDKEKENTDCAVGEGEEEGEEEQEGEGEDIGSFTPSPERNPLFSRFSVGGSAPPPRSLPCRNSPNDMTTTLSHPFVSCSDLGSSCNDNLNITLKDTLQREQKQGQKRAKQQTRPGLCFVRDRGGSDDVDENTYQQMDQPVRDKTPVSRTTLGRLERYRFEKVSVRK
ncbi:hypothetical protein D1P53_006315 [Cryptococcus gattii VGV]|nr:hypothetical protein D1P53_006315 [Cryptococcus gattii VGV]